jgi:membrane-bound lytic murein transglycosylase D
MKKSLVVAMILLSAGVAFAAEQSHLLQEMVVHDTPLARPEFTLPETADAGQPRDRVAALSGDTRVGEGVELSPSEIFSLEAALTKQVEEGFELKLPDEELPDSDIPLTVNNKVEYFIRYFQTSGKKAFSKWLSRSERFIPMMRQVLEKEGLPEDLVYLAMIESGFSPHAYSVAAAVGPWQFMSGTGRNYSLRINSWIDERRDPLKSTVAAALYLKELYALFNNDWYLAAAGYNAGENKILRAISRYNSRDFWELSKGTYLKRETKDYVPKLLAAAIIAKEPARYGFADVAYLPPVEFDTVTVPSMTDLELVAKICEVPYQTIKVLNPELRRSATPPDYPDYQLKIPRGKKAIFEAEYAKVPADKRYTEKTQYSRYRAKKRDTLTSIARRFGTTTATLEELNHLGKIKHLRGRNLIVPLLTSAAEDTVAKAPAEPVAAKTAEKTFNKYYTVKKGDTLASLARRFNVSAKILSTWNNLKTKVALRPGKRIIIAKYVEKKGELANAEDNG